MLNEKQLKTLVHAKGLSQTNRLLLCLAVGDDAKPVKEVKALAKTAGISKIDSWNVSQLLSDSDGAIRTPAGWELSSSGKKVVAELAGPLAEEEAPKAATALRSLLPSIKDDDVREFISQAVSCFEHKWYRAAVVLSWVGAVAVLYDVVVASHLASFNTEATRRFPKKWTKPAVTADDLATMGEYDFLQCLHAISVIGKSTKDELEACLKLRNGCGHPNSFKLGESRVSGHIDVLINNVFSTFR